MIYLFLSKKYINRQGKYVFRQRIYLSLSLKYVNRREIHALFLGNSFNGQEEPEARARAKVIVPS